MAQIQIETQESVIEKVQKLVEVLSDQGLEVAAAYLYGSYATGNPRLHSDIDVAIISPDISGIRVDDSDRLNVPASHIDARIQVIGLRPEQFRDEHPLAWEVKTKGIRLK